MRFQCFGWRRSTMSSRCFGGDGFDAVHSGCFLALVVLGDSTHCQESGCPRLHQKLLEFVDCLMIATLFSLKDALLYPVRLLLKLAPGQLPPPFTLRVKRCFSLHPGCLRISHTTCASFFHVFVPTLAYPMAFPLALAS